MMAHAGGAGVNPPHVEVVDPLQLLVVTGLALALKVKGGCEKAHSMIQRVGKERVHVGNVGEVRRVGTMGKSLPRLPILMMRKGFPSLGVEALLHLLLLLHPPHRELGETAVSCRRVHCIPCLVNISTLADMVGTRMEGRGTLAGKRREGVGVSLLQC